MIHSQGHDTPTHPNTPKHKPSVHKPAKPERPKADKGAHDRPARGGRAEKERSSRKRTGRKERKSAPVTERTLPIGSGVWVPVESLGRLPKKDRRH